MNRYFEIAKRIAVKGDTKEANRHFRLGAVGVRSDGVIVTSTNLPNRSPDHRSHAETRLARKLDWGATVYVVRIKRDGTLGISRPCKKCESALRLKGVKHCYYSISDREYGRMEL